MGQSSSSELSYPSLCCSLSDQSILFANFLRCMLQRTMQRFYEMQPICMPFVHNKIKFRGRCHCRLFHTYNYAYMNYYTAPRIAQKPFKRGCSARTPSICRWISVRLGIPDRLPSAEQTTHFCAENRSVRFLRRRRTD